MSILELALSVFTTVIDNVLFLLFVHQFVRKRTIDKRYAIAYILISIVGCDVIDFLGFPFLIKSAAVVLLGLLYCRLSLREQWGISAFLPSVFMALIFVSEFAVMGMAKSFFNGQLLTELEQKQPYQVFCMIVSRALLFLIVGILLLILGRRKSGIGAGRYNRPYWIMLCAAVAAFGSIVGVFGFSLTLHPELLEDIMHWFTFLFAIIFIIFFALIFRIARETERQYHLEAELRQTERQLLRQDELQAMHEKVRGLRHDFKNHLHIVASLAEQGKIKELREYLGELPGVQAGDQPVVETGDDFVDTLVNSKMVVAQSHGINMEVDICFPESVQIASSDICSILFNLLDNAIEACERNTEPENHRLRLTLRQQKGFLLVGCENPCEQAPSQQRGMFKSSKSGGLHGVGLGQLRRIANKYEGMFDANYENGIFHTRLLLPNDTESERFYVSRVSVQTERA